jgi:hypothetical protein
VKALSSNLSTAKKKKRERERAESMSKAEQRGGGMSGRWRGFRFGWDGAEGSGQRSRTVLLFPSMDLSSA